MKTARVILALSLLANAALVFAWMRLGTNHADVADDARGAESQSEPSGATPGARPPLLATPAVTTGTWAQIDSADLDELAQRLKAAGFSPQEVRVITSWKIAEQYPMYGVSDGNTPYWRNVTRDYSDPEFRRQQYAAMIGQHELSRKYIDNGEQLASDPERLEFERQRFGRGLSLEKIQAIRAVESDYMLLNLKQEQARMLRPGGQMDTSDQEARELLEKEKQAEIAALLTPEEFAEYELRNSRTSQTLRFQLEGFQPSEEEFRTLFAIHKPLEGVLADPTVSLPERQALMERITTEVADVLGPERAADYVGSQLGGDQTARLITRLGLPARMNATVRTLREDLTQQASAVRGNAGLSSADRAAQLGAIAQQAQTQLSTLLGEQGFEAYNDLKGEWIRALASEQGTP